jgi:AraC-like DNA-binding protein
MFLELDFSTIVYFISVIVGFITGLILFIYSIKKNKSNLPLSYTYLSLSIAIFFSLLVYSGLYIHFPWLYRVGNIFGYIFVPLPFIYVQSITQKRSFLWTDLLHFLPLLIYIVDYSPVFLLSSEEKLALIQLEINDVNSFTQFKQSRFFPDGFHQSFRTVLISFYWILQVWLLIQWKKGKNEGLNSFEKEWATWIIFFMTFQFLMFFPFYLTYFFISKQLIFNLIHLSGAILLVLSAFLLYLFPRLLYGLNQLKYVSDQIVKSKSDPPIIIKDHLPENKLLGLRDIMTKWIEEEKVYLNHRYSIRDLAKDTQIPYYQIAELINHYLNTSFSDLMNERRIDYCVELLKKGEFSNYTLEAISEECGFSNRNSFASAFKKFKGMTPSEFQKDLKTNKENLLK